MSAVGTSNKWLLRSLISFALPFFSYFLSSRCRCDVTTVGVVVAVAETTAATYRLSRCATRLRSLTIFTGAIKYSGLYVTNLRDQMAGLTSGGCLLATKHQTDRIPIAIASVCQAIRRFPTGLLIDQE